MPILTERERVGTRLAGKYDLGAIIGRGGMGTVFAGTHAWTGRKVAVKLLKPVLTEDANVVRRFLREARAASAIRHPNIVDVLDMGQEDDGAVYMVLELLEGDSLGSLLRRRRAIAPAELLPIVLPIADALVEVHGAGLVHRDLKPDNVFVALRRGRTIPKLLDFGIAKVLEASTLSRGTRTGAIVGTPHYMSPEQASGSRDVGPVSDVWSLGVVLYECLSGTLPFEAESATGVLVKIMTSGAQPLAQRAKDVPPQLAEIVTRAMDPDPRRRFADMRAMRDALRAAAEALAIAIPETVPEEDPASRTDEDFERKSTGEMFVSGERPSGRGASGSDPHREALAAAETIASDRPPATTPLPTSPPSTPSGVRAASSVDALPPPRSRMGWIAGGAIAVALAAVVYALASASGGGGTADASEAHGDDDREPESASGGVTGATVIAGDPPDDGVAPREDPASETAHAGDPLGTSTAATSAERAGAAVEPTAGAAATDADPDPDSDRAAHGETVRRGAHARRGATPASGGSAASGSEPATAAASGSEAASGAPEADGEGRRPGVRTQW